jgi:futalosine hydrolase
MLLTIVSATQFEVLRLRQILAPNATQGSDQFRLGQMDIHLLNTGVGLTNTALYLSRYLQFHSPDLLIHAGIAGTFDSNIAIGSTGLIVSERYADLGAEMADGSFQDLFELGLMSPNLMPFTNGRLFNMDGSDNAFLPNWHALSVQKVSGTQATIDALRQKYPDAQIENMEGAAFFQTCQAYGKPFLSIRSISNAVEVRNRDNWKMTEAVNALNDHLAMMIETLTS